jgi:Domain of unknown function (DUF1707)
MSEQRPEQPSPPRPTPSGVRASDEDRERLVSDLTEHAAAGRLDTGELEERLQAAYSARTTSELDALRQDLPSTGREAAISHAQRRSHLTRRMIQESGGAVILFLVSTAVWVVSGANSSFWPKWVLLIVLISLARNAWELFGPAPDLDRVERNLNRGRPRHLEHRSRRSGRRRPPR